MFNSQFCGERWSPDDFPELPGEAGHDLSIRCTGQPLALGFPGERRGWGEGAARQHFPAVSHPQAVLEAEGSEGLLSEGTALPHHLSGLLWGSNKMLYGSRQRLSRALQILIKWQPLYNRLMFVEYRPMSKEGT